MISLLHGTVIRRRASVLLSEFFVSSSGSDSNSGTEASPWRTLDKVSAYDAGTGFEPGNTISFKRGDRIDGVLTLSSSGTAGNEIVLAPYGEGAARPILSGGNAVTSWTLVDAPNRIWRATYAGSNPVGRSVWVDGIRCTRVRTAAGLPSGSTETATGYSTAGSSNPGYLSTAANITDIELVLESWWMQSRLPVESIIGNAITIPAEAWSYRVAASDYFTDAIGETFGRLPLYIENAREDFEADATDRTFYHDRSEGYLYVIPPISVTDLNASEVIIAAQEQVIIIEGASDIEVSGLTIAHTTALEPTSAAGLTTIQGPNYYTDTAGAGSWIYEGNSEMMKAAIRIRDCSRVAVTNCVVRDTSNCGIEISGASADCSLIGNVASGNGGCGIQTGHPTEPLVAPSGTIIRNNVVQDFGCEFASSVGIIHFYGADTIVEHNLVRVGTYSGISVGWGWGVIAANDNTNNSVKYNRVLGTHRRMHDGGGIYLNGSTGGTEVRHNYISATGTLGDFNEDEGIYADNGSSELLISDNIVTTHPAGNHVYKINAPGNNITIKDNFCDVTGEVNILGYPNGATGVVYENPAALGHEGAALYATKLKAGLESAFQSLVTEADAAMAIDPDNIDGLIFNLQADALTLSNNDPFVSGPYGTAQPTASKRPVFLTNVANGLPVLRFISDDYVEFPELAFGDSYKEGTIIAAARGTYFLLGSATLNRQVTMDPATGQIAIYDDVGGTANLETSHGRDLSYNRVNVAAWRFKTDAISSMWVNGIRNRGVTSNTTMNTITRIGLETYNLPFVGDVGAIVAFSKAVPDEDVERLMAGLRRFRLPDNQVTDRAGTIVSQDFFNAADGTALIGRTLSPVAAASAWQLTSGSGANQTILDRGATLNDSTAQVTQGLVADFGLADAFVSTLVRFNAAGPGTLAGLVLRWVDESNYLKVEFNEGALVVVKIVGGVRTQFFAQGAVFTLNTNVLLQARIVGSSLKVYFNSSLFTDLNLDLSDMDLTATRHGLRTYDSTLEFGMFTVETVT